MEQEALFILFLSLERGEKSTEATWTRECGRETLAIWMLLAPWWPSADDFSATFHAGSTLLIYVSEDTDELTF